MDKAGTRVQNHEAWRSTRWLAISSVLILSCGIARTGTGSLGSRLFDFSTQWVALVVPPMPPGLIVENLFSAWGVTISSETSLPPVSGILKLQVDHVADPPVRIDTPVLLNKDTEGSPGGTMRISFRSPLRRLSLTLGAEAPTNATVRFQAMDGTVLGQVTKEIGDSVPAEFPFEAPEGDEVSRVEVGYADPAVPEALILIVADFATPPVFRSCIAQFAHGALGGEERVLQTQLSITTCANATAFRIPDPVQAAVSLDFRDADGAPMPVFFDSEADSQLNFTLRPLESKILRTRRAASLVDVGCACATSNYPFVLAAVYRVLDSAGGPVAEAGIDASKPGYLFLGSFEKAVYEETNTALALANISPSQTTASITFFTAPNNTALKTEVIVLGAGEHRAWFIDELASQLEGRDAEGTVEIRSDAPIVTTLVRTIRGVVSASLPLDRRPPW